MHKQQKEEAIFRRRITRACFETTLKETFFFDAQRIHQICHHQIKLVLADRYFLLKEI